MQIRWKRARRAVEEELQAHLQDAAEGYEAEGTPAHEAQALAVRDMGDPVETGSLLDRVHRPRPCVPLIAAALVLLLLGAVVSLRYPDYSMYYGLGGMPLWGRLLLGGGILALVYFMDYTWFARNAIWLCCVAQGLGTLYFSRFGASNGFAVRGLSPPGWMYWIAGDGGFSSLYRAPYGVAAMLGTGSEVFLLFYLPLFAALLFWMRPHVQRAGRWARLGWLLLALLLSPLAPVLVQPLLLHSALYLLGVLLSLGLLAGCVCAGRLPLPRAATLLLCAGGAAAGIGLYARLAADSVSRYMVWDHFTLADWLAPGWAMVPSGQSAPSTSILYFKEHAPLVYGLDIPNTYNNQNLLMLDLYRFAGPLAALLAGALLVGGCVWMLYKAARLQSLPGRMVGLAAAGALTLQVALHLLNAFLLFGALEAPLPFLSDGVGLLAANAFCAGLLLSVLRMDSVVRVRPDERAKAREVAF